MNKPEMAKQAFQGIALAVLACGVFFAGSYFLQEDFEVTKTDSMEKPIGGITLPNGRTLNQVSKEGSSGQQIRVQKHVEAKKETDSGRKMDAHPSVTEEEILQREVKVPAEVKGKWKAVKLLIKNKHDEESNEFKVVELGQTIELEEGLTATVGPFFPNFVMNKLYYTSMNNLLLNPAVHIKVREKEKIIYDGWAFARYPGLYALEHDRYAIQLTDYIPAEVS